MLGRACHLQHPSTTRPADAAEAHASPLVGSVDDMMKFHVLEMKIGMKMLVETLETGKWMAKFMKMGCCAADSTEDLSENHQGCEF